MDNENCLMFCFPETFTQRWARNWKDGGFLGSDLSCRSIDLSCRNGSSRWEPVSREHVPDTRKDMEVLRMEKKYLSISWGSGSQ